jgi:hypothetical protein
VCRKKLSLAVKYELPSEGAFGMSTAWDLRLWWRLLSVGTWGRCGATSCARCRSVYHSWRHLFLHSVWADVVSLHCIQLQTPNTFSMLHITVLVYKSEVHTAAILVWKYFLASVMCRRRLSRQISGEYSLKYCTQFSAFQLESQTLVGCAGSTSQDGVP